MANMGVMTVASKAAFLFYTHVDLTKTTRGHGHAEENYVAAVTSTFLFLSVAVNAEPISIVWYCQLKDGSTKEDAMEINSRWLKWARATGGSDEITSSYVSTVVGEMNGFMWVDSYPDIATWGKVIDADSDFDAEFAEISTCSGNRILRAEETVAAK